MLIIPARITHTHTHMHDAN